MQIFEHLQISRFYNHFFKIKLYAIEKNPSAVKILNMRNEDKWKGAVEVIHTDMRLWKPKEKLDIIVSELLGKILNSHTAENCVLHSDVWFQKKVYKFQI